MQLITEFESITESKKVLSSLQHGCGNSSSLRSPKPGTSPLWLDRKPDRLPQAQETPYQLHYMQWMWATNGVEEEN